MRSMLMLSVLVIYPILICFVFVPYFADGDDLAITLWISSYLFLILGLQIFGSWRSLKSFEEKKKLKASTERYKPQKFVWNLGSCLAIALLIYEVFQFSIFAYSQSTAEKEEESGAVFDSQSLSFLKNGAGDKIL